MNYIMYLRKSRADDPSETVEEVLAKHELILQKYAIEKFGYRITEDNIYREIVSGETIEDRPMIKEVLKRMESPSIYGVLVVDVQRLSRGDLIDCGTIINAFKYSQTLIITPSKTFDLSNEDSFQNYDMKLLKMELNNGSEYLEYTKMILNRGRLLSAQRGNYIGSIAPYGYDKAIVNKNHTLCTNQKEYKIKKIMVDLRLNKKYGYQKIANELDALGYKPRKSKHWNANAIKDILLNPVNAGLIKWYRRKTITILKDGRPVKTRPRNDNYILVKGIHPAHIDIDTFHKLEEMHTNNPKINKKRDMVNPFSSLVYCKKCGHAIIYRNYGDRCKPRCLCTNQRNCHTKSSKYEDICSVLISSLEQIINDFEFRIDQNDIFYINRYNDQIEELEKELLAIEDRQNELYDLLESKIYSRDVFIQRNNKLAIEREKNQKKLANLIVNKPKEINYDDKIIQVKQAIKLLKDDSVDAKIKNDFFKSIIERIEYSREEDNLILDVFLK